MKISFFTCIALSLAFLSPNSSQGAIEAFSTLGISEFGLYHDTGAGMAGAPITAGVDFNLIGATFSSSASADLQSVAGPITSTGILPILSSTGLDTPQASEGLGAPAENTFSKAGTPSVARGDTFGTGAAVAGVPGEVFGASASTVAEVELSIAPNNTNSGRADSAVTSFAAFTLIPTHSIDVVGIFGASKELLADLTPTPPGFSATADISFSISIAESGSPFFSWTPDGLAGGIVGGNEYLDPFSLNDNVSGFPGLTIGSITGSGTFSAGFTLRAGQPYSFTIDHSSAATATNIAAVVPEPTAFVVWGLLSAAVGIAYRRKSAL